MARGRGKYTPNDIEIMKRISVNINELLNRTRTKQVELSKHTGIPTSTLTGYVKGTSMPNPGNVQKRIKKLPGYIANENYRKR